MKAIAEPTDVATNHILLKVYHQLMFPHHADDKANGLIKNDSIIHSSIEGILLCKSYHL
jgi:hypothetical protein